MSDNDQQQPSVRPRGVFGEEAYEEAKRVIWEGLRATKRVRAAGRSNYEDAPDDALRVKCAELVIEHEIGKPTTKQEISVQGGKSRQKALTQSELLESARRDPAMAARIASGYIESLKHPDSDDDQEVTDV